MSTTSDNNHTVAQAEARMESQAESVEAAMKEAVERVEKSVTTAREALTDTFERGERLLKSARYAAEGYMDDAVYHVRHNPRSTLAIAVAVGAIAGGLITLMMPRRTQLADTRND